MFDRNYPTGYATPMTDERITEEEEAETAKWTEHLVVSPEGEPVGTIQDEYVDPSYEPDDTTMASLVTVVMSRQQAMMCVMALMEHSKQLPVGPAMEVARTAISLHELLLGSPE